METGSPSCCDLASIECIGDLASVDTRHFRDERLAIIESEAVLTYSF